MNGNLYNDYNICANCIHASVCKYSLKVKSMIEAIDNAVTDRFATEGPTRCIVEYPLKLKVECELFRAKIVNPR